MCEERQGAGASAREEACRLCRRAQCNVLRAGSAQRRAAAWIGACIHSGTAELAPAFLWLPLPPLPHALQRLAASSTMAREGAAVAGECWSAVVRDHVLWGPGRDRKRVCKLCAWDGNLRAPAPRCLRTAAAAAAAAACCRPGLRPASPLPCCSPALQIPVQLRLADSEVTSLEQPPTLYVSAGQRQGGARCHMALTPAECWPAAWPGKR